MPVNSFQDEVCVILSAFNALENVYKVLWTIHTYPLYAYTLYLNYVIVNKIKAWLGFVLIMQ